MKDYRIKTLEGLYPVVFHPAVPHPAYPVNCSAFPL
jgi:hypothetical protein